MERIPNEIRMYLKEIADRLAQGRACVMVGAGFSKNAEKIKDTKKTFLDWNQLGDLFYKKIYGHMPDESSAHYLDVLKLAGIVEYSFGRSVLDKMLLEYLPDEEYGPSDLHKKLLELNWSDIFTTNYDTLLERSRKYVAGRKYQVVLSIEDLVYSRYPRIIKLHGSFPSERPFIITKEDYRRYPKKFAAFVNTVQQSLLENVMCLIGFSGDDPNFENWIGWIRDNLGNGNASKIYLVTVDSTPRIDQALLAAKNIIVINMTDCFSEKNVSYKEGLRLFLETLQKYQANDNKVTWLSEKVKPLENIQEYLARKEVWKEDIKSKMSSIEKFWESSRKKISRMDCHAL